MQVPKIGGQTNDEKQEIKAKKEEEKIGNLPLVQKNKDTPPPEDAGWSSLGVDIKKGAIATGEAFEKVIEMNNPEHLAGPAVSGAIASTSVAQVAASLPSPKPTPEEVIADENKNLEMKSCLEDAKGVKDFKRLLKPKTDK